jgi:hypothetical protein
MRFYVLRNWLLKELNPKQRLKEIVLWYVISLMIITRKHSLDHASSISGKSKSLFSRLLKEHPQLAVLTLCDLSKREARKYSKAMQTLKGLPWKVAMLIDLTDQGRSSLHAQNSKKLNHGKGYFIGHQWTNIVLCMGDKIIPLPPIAFYSRKYCWEKKIEHRTEHERVIDYLKALDLSQYIEGYRPQDVVVLADSGYDDHRIEKVVLKRGWDFVFALKNARSVKSNAEYLTTKPSQGWREVETFFKAQRRLGWETIRLFTSGLKRKRKDFRIRCTWGWLKSVGPVQLVCSERKNAPHGRRKYLACSHLKLKPRQITLCYSLRWRVELFHKTVKMHLGFEDISASSFDSVIAHVHWVYCAYLLLGGDLPALASSAKGILERQQHVQKMLDHKEKAHLLQRLTRINGLKEQKSELKTALAA